MRGGVGGICIFFASLLAGLPAVYALKNTQGIIEVGDTISFSMPIGNAADNGVVLEDVQPEITASQPWLTLLPTSITDAIDLPPGENITFLDRGTQYLIPDMLHFDFLAV